MKTSTASKIGMVDSYHSVKCIGVGNGRKQSKVTAKLRRQVNKCRRKWDKKKIAEQEEE